MDVYDLRRLIVERVIKKRYNGNQADFCGMTGLSPSYVTRMLKPQTESAHKKIGETMARRLEAVEDLGLHPNELLDPVEPGRGAVKRPPKPARDFQDRHDVTDSDWATLQAVKTFIPERELAEMRERYARVMHDAKEDIRRLAEAKDD